MTGVCVNRLLNSKWKFSRVSCTWNACKWIECTSFLVELPAPTPVRSVFCSKKRKFLIETGPEREKERKESFIKYSSTGTANRSPNFFHRIPSNHCKTSSKLLCPNTVHIISHRSMLISSKETKRNSRFFEFIFHCRSILKKHLLIHWNISTCIARRSENSINFHQVSTYRQSPLSLTLTLPPKLSRRWQEARV